MYVYLNCKAGRVNKQIATKNQTLLTQIDYQTADGEVFSASCIDLTKPELYELRKDYDLRKFKLTVSIYKDIPQINFFGPVEDKQPGLDDDEVEFADFT